MIAAHRRCHRTVWLILAVTIPLILVVAWQSRREPAVMDRLPALLQEPKP